MNTKSISEKTKEFVAAVHSHLPPWELEDGKRILTYCPLPSGNTKLKVLQENGRCIVVNLFNETIYQSTSHSQALGEITPAIKTTSFFDKRGLVYGWISGTTLDLRKGTRVTIDCNLFPFSPKTIAEIILAAKILRGIIPGSSEIILEHGENLFSNNTPRLEELSKEPLAESHGKVFIGESTPTLYMPPYFANQMVSPDEINFKKLLTTLSQDIPEATIVSDDHGTPLVWQFHKDFAVTKPFYLILDLPQENRRALIMKPYNHIAESYNHFTEEYIGFELLQTIGGRFCGVYRGKDYQYIEFFNGIDFMKFLRELKRNSFVPDIEKAFYCLGRAFAEAFIFGISDRYKDGSSNMMVDVDMIMNLSLDEIRRLELSPVVHIDLASSLAYVNQSHRKKYLAEQPEADLDFFLDSLELLPDLERREQFFIDGFFDRFQSIQKYFILNRDRIVQKIKILAGDLDTPILKRLDLSPDELKAIKNKMFDIVMQKMAVDYDV